jgi:CYTH domain-containing protein
LAVKSKTESLANGEFEYEIPQTDAEELIAHHCLRAELAIPAWIGREVTGNPDYKKINMVNARVGTARS